MKFQKGIPYTDALERLNRAFSPKPGDLLTHEQLRAVIQADEIRYRGILTAWRKELRARGLKTSGRGRASGIGIEFLDGRGDAAHIDRETVLMGRKAKRLAIRADDVDTTDFTEPENLQHNMRKRLAHEHAKVIEKGNKELRAPPAAASDNVRVLKTS